jgi:uncharacterized protein YkwD
MIGGVIVDLLAAAAVIAFAWGATQLGGISTLGRLVEAIVAFTIAVVLRDPAGNVVGALLGRSVDFNRLVGMVLVGLATWIAAHSVFRWWRARREAARMGDLEYEYDIEAEPEPDPLDAPIVARVAGGLIGLGWVVLFLAMLVLQPADTPISRSAVDSRIGGALISGEQTLRWLRDGFPHYTQTLPKGKLGAIVGERSALPMREPVEVEEIGGDADTLLRSINQLRRNSRVGALVFNPDVAAVARRHAASLADRQTLSYRGPGGGALDRRVLSALGASAGAFSEEVGIEVLWAHDPDTAMRGLLASARSTSLLRDPRWTEVGIGVVEAGWFNGRIYVLLLVGSERVDGGNAADDADPPGDGLSGDAALTPGVLDPTIDGSTGAGSELQPIDPFAPEPEQ